MNEVEQLENSVSRLSAEDLDRFRTWFRTFDAQRAVRSDPAGDETLVEQSLADYGSGEPDSDRTRRETPAGALRRVAAASGQASE